MYSFRITHEVSVRSLDVLTQLQEMATSGVHEHYPMISFTRDNPFPNRLRQSGRVWRIALVQTLTNRLPPATPNPARSSQYALLKRYGR